MDDDALDLVGGPFAVVESDPGVSLLPFIHPPIHMLFRCVYFSCTQLGRARR